MRGSTLWAGGPFKPAFGLSGGSSTAGQSFPAARSRFRAVHSDSISTCPSQPVERAPTGYARRCAEVVEAGSSAAFDWRCGSFLAKEVHGPQFVEKLRYIHRNPVERGLCQRREDWPWSSFRHCCKADSKIRRLASVVNNQSLP